MELLELSPADIESIQDLFLSVFAREPWNDDWSDGVQLRRYLIDLTGNPNSLTFAWAEGGELIALAMGHVKHWYRGTEYLIDEFCVRTERQGEGVGTRFLAQIEAYLRERGIRAIFLLTDRDVPAYAFYRRRGFEEQTTTVAFAKRV